MDELAAARVQLVRLEENERKLVEKLSVPPLVQRLPVELLSSIFHLALGGTNPSRKGILAPVSRLCLAREHLRKSREALLDITLQCGVSFASYSTIGEGLELLVPYGNRWRSLSLYTSSRACPCRSILDRIGSIEILSLKSVKLNLRAYSFVAFGAQGLVFHHWIGKFEPVDLNDKARYS
ncbi:hypothetical protein BKA82DRAFT_29381 [Pisolithus tinctorius]|nr:hypothetical protein BKA82DRAFT_29381 [Pisolithus tinctorius]